MPDWNSKINETTEKAEAELKRLITYLNDEVVPDVRRHGVAGLRSTADALQALARTIEENGRQ